MLNADQKQAIAEKLNALYIDWAELLKAVSQSMNSTIHAKFTDEQIVKTTMFRTARTHTYRGPRLENWPYAGFASTNDSTVSITKCDPNTSTLMFELGLFHGKLEFGMDRGDFVRPSFGKLTCKILNDTWDTPEGLVEARHATAPANLIMMRDFLKTDMKIIIDEMACAYECVMDGIKADVAKAEELDAQADEMLLKAFDVL